MDFPPELKPLSLAAARDRTIKTSSRLMAFCLYTFIRMCEGIDYLFPVN